LDNINQLNQEGRINEKDRKEDRLKTEIENIKKLMLKQTRRQRLAASEKVISQVLKYFQQGKRIFRKDPDAAKKLEESEIVVKKVRFIEAISANGLENHSVDDYINFNSIKVEQHHRIEGENVTLEFIKKVMGDFKNLEGVHLKYYCK